MLADTTHGGLHVSAGNGVVARLEHATVLVKGDERQQNKLVEQLDSLENAPWIQVIRAVTASITAAGFTGHPSVSCLAIEDETVSAFVFGTAQLSLIIDGSTTILDGRDSSTWIDMVFRGRLERAHAGSRAPVQQLGVLHKGIVLAGGFLYEPSAAAPAIEQWNRVVAEPHDRPQAAETEPSGANNSEAPSAEVPQPSDDDAVEDGTGMFVRLSQISPEQQVAESELNTPVHQLGAEPSIEPPSYDVDTTASSAQILPTPQVGKNAEPADVEAAPAVREANTAVKTVWKERPKLKGVFCTNGHFTRHDMGECFVCGTLLDVTDVVLAARPILGHLVFDDGAVLQIDRPVVVGADVPPGYAVDGEPTSIVRLDDGHNGVSDVQLEIRAVGWNLQLVDLATANGTYTLGAKGRHTRTRLRSGQKIVLRNGMLIEVGTRTFTFGVGPRPATTA